MLASSQRSYIWLFALCLGLCGLTSPAAAQLRVLSKGNTLEKWREAQVNLLKQQLVDPQLSPDLELELQSQVQWLDAWRPGRLTKAPLWEAESVKIWTEPTLDPQNLATELREQMLGEKAHPTPAETQRLQDFLSTHPDDLGVRQLHLHWLDQAQYRTTYPSEIAAAAARVVELLASTDGLTDVDREQAQAFALYRRGRAFIYRLMPEVVAKLPLEEGEAKKVEEELVGTYLQLKQLVKGERPEFILLETHMLKRDNWHGRALALIERHGNQLSSEWFLRNRSLALRDLGWLAPADEALAILEAEFPKAEESTEP